MSRKVKRSDIFRKLNTEYRVVFIDEETLEEVGSYRMTMGKLYTVLSTIFVLIVVITVCITLVTPLKYYIPGYDDLKVGREYRQMKYRVDSLEKQMDHQTRYIDNIKRVLNGDAAALDTTALKVPKDELSED